MVQARGIQIRENVKTIGAQVLEQVVRGAYSINGTGTNTAEFCGKRFDKSPAMWRMLGILAHLYWQSNQATITKTSKRTTRSVLFNSAEIY